MAAIAANPFLASQGGTNPFMGSGASASANTAPAKNPFLASSGGKNPFMSSGSGASAKAPVTAPSPATQWGSTPSAPTTQVTPAPTSTPLWGSGGGNPITTTAQQQPHQGGIGGVLHSIGKGIGAVNNDLSAGLQGFWGGLSHPGAENPVSGAIHGLAHPAQEHQIYNSYLQQQNKGISNPVGRVLNSMTSGVETDPLTYVPLGKVAELAHVPQALKVVKGAVGTGVAKIPALSKAAENVKTTAGEVTKALPGTTKVFKGAVSRLYGERQSGAHAVNTQLKEAFKNTTPAQRKEFTHLWETTEPGTKFDDPKLESVRQKVEPIMQKAEQHARSQGLLTKSLDLKQMGVKRYMPHVHVNKFDANGNPMTNGRLLKSSLDSNKTRDIAGTIKDINASGKAKFEDDALKVLAHHLHSLNNASTATDLINHTLENGLDIGGAHGLTEGDLHPDTKTPLVEYSHDGKSALVPSAHAEFINGLSKTKEGGLSKVSRGMTNFWNRTMFAGNPIYHPLVNLLPQAIMHAPSALPDIAKSLPEAFKGVKPGSEMDKAVKAGAMNLFSNIAAKGNTAKRVESLVNAVDHEPGTAQKVLHEWNAFTPKSEMAFRSGVFNNALKKGATETEAANKVRKIFGGHIAPGTMSDAEKSVSMLMPFINWTKTSIGSNVGKALTNPFRYSVLGHGLNAINQENSGHGILQNPNPVSIAVGKNAQGNTRYASLPGAVFDAAKLAKSIDKEGLVHGVADFAQSRFTPWINFLDQMRTGEQNPSAPITQQFSVNPAPHAKYATKYSPQQIQEAQQRGMFFGDNGPKANPYLAQFLQDVSIPGADMMPEKGQPVFPSIIARLLGSSLSTPNPLSAIKEGKYNARLGNEEVKSQLRKRTQTQH